MDDSPRLGLSRLDLALTDYGTAPPVIEKKAAFAPQTNQNTKRVPLFSLCVVLHDEPRTNLVAPPRGPEHVNVVVKCSRQTKAKGDVLSASAPHLDHVVAHTVQYTSRVLQADFRGRTLPRTDGLIDVKLRLICVHIRFPMVVAN
jgi:hypothetical protein